MRSIRLSLIGYFLVLLSLALGGVSWFAYQTTARALLGKQTSTASLIQAQYETRRDEMRTALDRRILEQAKILPRKARFRDPLEVFYPIPVVLTRLQPHGYLNVGLWMAPYGLLVQPLHKIHPSEIVIEDADAIIPDADQNHAQEYFQTYSANGRVQQRSEKMGTLVLTLDKDIRKNPEPFVEHFETVEPEPGWKLRVVTLKGYMRPRFGSLPFPDRPPFRAKNPNAKGPKSPDGEPSSRPPAGMFPGRNFPPPIVYVQYGSDTSVLDQKLMELRDERDAQLAQQEEETRAALLAMRLRLLWICLATFAGIVAGGLVLVRVGLAPLARLSEAVSQVSEKDFRLKVDTQDLPRELQPIAARLTGTLEQLQHAFSREKQAAADISHELRTPLAAMMTTLEVSLRKVRTVPEYREMLEDIRASGTQMAHLVERLLALARLDAGADRLRTQEIDARDVARQCTNLIRPLAEARGLALRLHAPEPVPLKVDPDKLREILNNLLHNAVEYNRPEGAIDLNVARVNGHVRLAVHDTGIGIAPELRAKIFERFFRADPSRHADTPHAGLGLAIVRSYVELMGGTIGVDSGTQGSTFTVELPVP
ncbi:MAG TPA: HAMP domain-containing sensor histidine kinase [Gemmataceae bacterium]|jgi:heavy metal sensor kinase|nr:HAMP domain-containing sensor histidine kinase [Gemmataceae bacterium]